MANRILIASDHAGFELKNKIIQKLSHLEFQDLGTNDSASVDYPDYADKVGSYINQHPKEIGILICGSGQGMCMTANKYQHVRAALVYNVEIAKLSREHNDANVLCLGARFLDLELAVEIIEAFLKTEFAGGRHQNRVSKMEKGGRS